MGRRRIGAARILRTPTEPARPTAPTLSPAPNPRNRAGKTGRRHSPEERRLAVESYRSTGLTRRDFAKTFGVTVDTLSDCPKFPPFPGTPQDPYPTR